MVEILAGNAETWEYLSNTQTIVFPEHWEIDYECLNGIYDITPVRKIIVGKTECDLGEELLKRGLIKEKT